MNIYDQACKFLQAKWKGSTRLSWSYLAEKAYVKARTHTQTHVCVGNIKERPGAILDRERPTLQVYHSERICWGIWILPWRKENGRRDFNPIWQKQEPSCCIDNQNIWSEQKGALESLHFKRIFAYEEKLIRLHLQTISSTYSIKMEGLYLFYLMDLI